MVGFACRDHTPGYHLFFGQLTIFASSFGIALRSLHKRNRSERQPCPALETFDPRKPKLRRHKTALSPSYGSLQPSSAGELLAT